MTTSTGLTLNEKCADCDELARHRLEEHGLTRYVCGMCMRIAITTAKLEERRARESPSFETNWPNRPVRNEVP